MFFFFSAYNCIATFAIARSQVSDILALLHSAATFHDRLSVSVTTDVDLEDSFIYFKYQCFYTLSSHRRYLEVQSTHIGASPDYLLNLRSEVQRKLCCCAFFKELVTLIYLSSVNGSRVDFTIFFIKTCLTCLSGGRFTVNRNRFIFNL